MDELEFFSVLEDLECLYQCIYSQQSVSTGEKNYILNMTRHLFMSLAEMFDLSGYDELYCLMEQVKAEYFIDLSAIEQWAFDSFTTCMNLTNEFNQMQKYLEIVDQNPDVSNFMALNWLTQEQISYCQELLHYNVLGSALFYKMLGFVSSQEEDEITEEKLQLTYYDLKQKEKNIKELKKEFRRKKELPK